MRFVLKCASLVYTFNICYILISLYGYFNAVELNNDDSIDVAGWEKIEKRGNQVIITVSSDLKQW